MKKLVIISLMYLLATGTNYLFCQESDKQKISITGSNIINSANENKTSLPTLSLGINPAGFLMFGPSVHADVKLFGRTYLSGYFIYHSMGMLSEAMIFGDNPNQYGNNCWGFAAGLKQYFKPNAKMNVWYAGLFSGYSYNQATYNEGPPEECTEKIKSVVFAANFGYRWNLGERFYLASGIIGGISYSNEDKLYNNYVYDFESMNYVPEERLVEDYSGEIYPYLFVEITLGIQL